MNPSSHLHLHLHLHLLHYHYSPGINSSRFSPCGLYRIRRHDPTRAVHGGSSRRGLANGHKTWGLFSACCFVSQRGPRRQLSVAIMAGSWQAPIEYLNSIGRLPEHAGTTACRLAYHTAGDAAHSRPITRHAIAHCEGLPRGHGALAEIDWGGARASAEPWSQQPPVFWPTTTVDKYIR
jgi:hypothetical protein